MQTRLPWKRPRTGPRDGTEDEARVGNGIHDARERAGDGEAPITNGGAVRDAERPQDPPAVDADPAPAQESPPKPPPVIVPRWVQLVVLPIALLGLWALARASG
ncbi:MAG: hypothetical protein JO179_06705, partial [Solirubrobacterales bacterium]|nr:hypothetical protein [Solirubrobacterales bacterium]